MQSKWIATSMTIWGFIVMALPGIKEALGYFLNVDIGDIGQLDEAVKNLLFALDQVIGGVLVVVGRLRANTKVTLLPGGK